MQKDHEMKTKKLIKIQQDKLEEERKTFDQRMGQIRKETAYQLQQIQKRHIAEVEKRMEKFNQEKLELKEKLDHLGQQYLRI